MKTPKVGSSMRTKVIATGTSGIAHGTVRMLRTSAASAKAPVHQQRHGERDDQDRDVDGERVDERVAEHPPEIRIARA